MERVGLSVFKLYIAAPSPLSKAVNQAAWSFSRAPVVLESAPWLDDATRVISSARMVLRMGPSPVNRLAANLRDTRSHSAYAAGVAGRASGGLARAPG